MPLEVKLGIIAGLLIVGGLFWLACWVHYGGPDCDCEE